MWRNAFGAYLDLHRPLCFGRGIPFVPLPGLWFYLYSDFPVEAEIGRYYETPDYISHSDTKRSDELRIPPCTQLYAEAESASGSA